MTQRCQVQQYQQQTWTSTYRQCRRGQKDIWVQPCTDMYSWDEGCRADLCEHRMMTQCRSRPRPQTGWGCEAPRRLLPDQPPPARLEAQPQEPWHLPAQALPLLRLVAAKHARHRSGSTTHGEGHAALSQMYSIIGFQSRHHQPRSLTAVLDVSNQALYPVSPMHLLS